MSVLLGEHIFSAVSSSITIAQDATFTGELTCNSAKIGGSSGATLSLNAQSMLESDLPIYSSANEISQYPTGFENTTDSVISYDYSTQTVTITPTSSSFSAWVRGKKFTFTDAQNVTHAASNNLYYIHVDTNGAFAVHSGRKTDIVGFTMCCAVYYYTAGATTSYCVNEMRYDCIMDTASRSLLHNQIGSYLTSGCDIGDYTVDPATPASSHNNFSMASGVMSLDMLSVSISAMATGGYTAGYRVAYLVDDDFLQFEDVSEPYITGTTGGYIMYNQDSSPWTTTELANNKYVNYYVSINPSIEEPFYYICMGQEQHDTLSDAQAESVLRITTATNRPPGLLRLYKVTFYTDSGYGTTGKCRIASVIKIVGESTNVIQGDTGPVGPKGDTGATGAKGDTGPQGPEGSIDAGAVLTLTNATDASSTSTGALVISNGGIGCHGNAYIGGNLNVAGSYVGLPEHNSLSGLETATASVTTYGHITNGTQTIGGNETFSGSVVVGGDISVGGSYLGVTHDGLPDVALAAAGVTYGHIDNSTQTIAGNKTFSNSVTVGGDLTVSGSYVGLPAHNSLSTVQLAASGVTYGHIDDGAQSIYGVKTFVDQPVFSGGLSLGSTVTNTVNSSSGFSPVVSVAFKFFKVGSVVTMTFPTFSGTANGSTTFFISVPSGYRPNYNVYPSYVIGNSGFIVSRMTITTSGYVYMYRTANGTSFSSGSTTVYAGSASWFIN